MVMASSMSGHAVAHLAAHALKRQAGVLVDDGHAHAGVAALGRHVQSARWASRRAGEFHAQAAGLGPRVHKGRGSLAPRVQRGRMNGLVGARLKTAAATHAARGEVLGRAGAGRPQQGQWRRRSRGDRARREDARGGQGGDSRQTHSQTPSVCSCGRHTGGVLRRSFRSRLAGDPAAASLEPDCFGAQSRRQLSPSRRDSCPLFHGDG